MFDILRHELIYGDGVPLGLVGAGFAFTGLSYFWSPGFLCSLRYKARLWRKAFLFVSMFVAGALVVTTAPATAVLIIPQDQLWQAGGSPFYLQGKESDIWPTVLTHDLNRDPPFCQCSASAGSLRKATEYAVCPSGGYKSLAFHYSEVNVSSFLDSSTTLPYVADLMISNFMNQITIPRLEVPTQPTLGCIRTEGRGMESFLVQPHVTSITFRKELTVDWWHAIYNQAHNIPRKQARYRYYTDLGSTNKTQIPKVGVTCTLAQEVPTDTTVEIEFPTLPLMDRNSKTTATKIPKYDSKPFPSDSRGRRSTRPATQVSPQEPL